MQNKEVEKNYLHRLYHFRSHSVAARIKNITVNARLKSSLKFARTIALEKLYASLIAIVEKWKEKKKKFQNMIYNFQWNGKER